MPSAKFDTGNEPELQNAERVDVRVEVTMRAARLGLDGR